MSGEEPGRIIGPPASGYYFPDFITAEEEAKIQSDVNRVPKGKWTVLIHRRLLSLPSTLSGSAKDTLLAASLPKFLDKPIVDRLRENHIFAQSPHKAPNHVLINEYQPGQGIMPHEDGPAYHPITATVSLGGHTVLEIYEKNEKGEREAEPRWKILQEPRSLLVTTGNMYRDTLHGISDLTEDRDLGPDSIINWNLLGNQPPFETGTAERHTRISLTYRDVLKVAKLGGAMKFMNKK